MCGSNITSKISPTATLSKIKVHKIYWGTHKGKMGEWGGGGEMIDTCRCINTIKSTDTRHL